MEQLKEQVLRLEAQIRELSRSPGKVSVSVETTPTKGATPTGADASPVGTLHMSANIYIHLTRDQIHQLL